MITIHYLKGKRKRREEKNKVSGVISVVFTNEKFLILCVKQEPSRFACSGKNKQTENVIDVVAVPTSTHYP